MKTLILKVFRKGNVEMVKAVLLIQMLRVREMVMACIGR